MINKLFKLNKNLSSVTVETKLRANFAMLHDLSIHLSTNTLISAIRVPTSIKYGCMKRKIFQKDDNSVSCPESVSMFGSRVSVPELRPFYFGTTDNGSKNLELG